MEVFPHLEVDTSLLLNLSVGIKGAVGTTKLVISSNWADSCLSKGGKAVVSGISIKDKERETVVLGRSKRQSWNDLSEAMCTRAGRLRLEAGPQAGFCLSKGARQGRGARGLTSLSLGGVCSAALG